MLIFTRALYDVLEIPGHETLIVSPGTDRHQAAREWWNQHEGTVAAQEYESEYADWRGRLEDWKARTRVEFGRDRLYAGSPRVEVAKIKLPDGEERTVRRTDADSCVGDAFSSRHEKPKTVDDRYLSWWYTVKVRGEFRWVGHLFEGGDGRPVLSDPVEGKFGYPVQEVLSTLDALSAAGWKIVHVSEERALIFDRSPVSSVGVVRYLLSRTA